jgi:lipopolysaccharide assembly outer membrane protein LptD (OstA)
VAASAGGSGATGVCRRAGRWRALALAVLLLAPGSAAAQAGPAAAQAGPAAAQAGSAAAQAGSAAARAGSSGPRFSGPFAVTADEVEYDAQRDVYIARGHVEIKQKDRTLQAGRVLFSEKTHLGVASGNVVVTQAGDTLRSDFLEFNVDNLQGVVFHGRLVSDSSLFEMSGQEVRKTGDQTYVFTKGKFTTCRCPKPNARNPWSITAGKANLEVEGYARAKNATFQVLDVPVLWAPYLVLPLKRERQTGFLFPEIAVTSRDGFVGGLPFFWAPRDDVGLTLTPEYLTKRGFKPKGELEYVFGERGRADLYGTWVDDQEVSSNKSTRFDAQRWAFRGQQIQELPLGSWFAAQGIDVSDNNVPIDFRDFYTYRPDRYLNSDALAGTRFGPEHAFEMELAALVSNDMQNPTDQDRDKTMLQRLPQVGLDAFDGPVPGIPGLVATTDVQFVDFQSLGHPGNRTRSLQVGNLFYDTGADGVPDGQERNGAGIPVAYDANHDNGITEGDGHFEEGEPLADRGGRLVAHPRVAYPIRLANLVDVTPEIGWYGTFYETQLAGFDSRNLATARVDVSTRMEGRITLPFGIGGALHFIEPHVTWLAMTGAGQNNNPLFVPETAVPQDRLRQLEVDNQLLDPSDRLHELNSLIFGLGNRFLSLGNGRLLGEFELSSEYRFLQAEWGPLVLQGEVRLPRGWWLRSHLTYQLGQYQVGDGLLDFGWSNPAGHFLGFRYRYIRNIPHVFEAFQGENERWNSFDPGFQHVNQLGAFGRFQVNRQWALTYGGAFSFENVLSLTNQFGIEYVSRCKCWAVRLEFDDDRVGGFQWHLNYRLLGLGDDREHPFRSRGARRFDAIQGL